MAFENITTIEKPSTPVEEQECINNLVDAVNWAKANAWFIREGGAAYNVGDVVNCPYFRDLELVCTQAGTTADALLNKESLIVGENLTDGTCEWTVRNKTLVDKNIVRSVNGNPADSDGDVNVGDYITGLAVDGTIITYTKKDGTPSTITTQDTVYSHPNSGVTAGTYDRVTVNAQGHVTGGANHTKAYLTATYISGTSWYRKWSDGWIEQGGRLGNGSKFSGAVNLVTAFSNTNYTITCSATGPDSSGSYPGSGVRPHSTTQFYAVQYYATYNASWYACGY